MAGSLA